MGEMRIAGERIYLRPVRISDANGPYHKWMNDQEVTQFLESRFAKNTTAEIRKFIRNARSDPDVLFLAIVLGEGDRHIGNIKLGPVNRKHRSAEIGIMIGEKDCWGKGYGTEAVTLLVEHAFGKMKLHKLTAGCYANNVGSAKTFLRAGFEQEGRKKSQCLSGSRYVDVLLFGIVNHAQRE